MTKTKIAPWFNIATQFWWVEGEAGDHDNDQKLDLDQQKDNYKNKQTMMTMTKTTTMTKTKIAPWFNIATQFCWVEGGTGDQNEILEEKSLFDYFSTICSLLTNASVFVVWPCVIYWQTATCGQVKSCPSISFSIRSQIVPDQWSTLKPERLKTENRKRYKI